MNPPLRILMVSDVSPLAIHGGAERMLWETASRLAARGHRVRVLSRAPGDALPEAVAREGVSIIHFPCNRRSSLSFLLSSVLEARRSVRRHLAAEPCDVLQVYQPLSGYGVFRSPQPAGLPSLYTFLSPAPLEYVSRRGMSIHHRRGAAGRAVQILLWWIERACVRRANLLHVLSQFSADQLWRLYGASSDRIVRIPGAADLERFTPANDRRALRRALGLPDGIPLLLTVRNLEARMGLDALIRAVAILRRSIPEVLLLIGGAGALRANLESLVAALGLQEQVRFLGYIPEDDLPRYYQAADAFVLPTRELEGFGLITVEAMACGTPVLGTAVGATPEILLPLDPSLLFREATPEVMAAHLEAFLAGPYLQKETATRLRKACRRHVEERYGWDLAVERLEATLHELAGHRSNPRPPTRYCPACGDARQMPDLLYGGTPYGRCPRCGTGASGSMPSSATLHDWYETDYPIRYRPDHVQPSRVRLFSSVLDRLGSPGTVGRLLDVGCGGGHLSAAATGRGWRAVGTDLSHRACTVARDARIPAVQADGTALPLRSRSMDAVCLVNVLDHLPDPHGTLREAFRVLAPGGRLAIRVPNAAFHRPCVRLLTSLGPLARWRGWDRYPILHLFTFPAAGLRRLTIRTGFRVLEVRNSPVLVGWIGGPEDHASHATRRTLFRLVAIGARSIEVLSRSRLLLGPSIELYAERPRGDSGDGR